MPYFCFFDVHQKVSPAGDLLQGSKFSPLDNFENYVTIDIIYQPISVYKCYNIYMTPSLEPPMVLESWWPNSVGFPSSISIPRPERSLLIY